jgi:sugar fermentation stimulation protein A
VQLFVIQRTDCDHFAACADLDPTYAAGLTVAADAGVEVLAYACDITPEAVTIAHRIPWRDSAA